MHELNQCGANGRLVARVVSERHGWQKFIPIQCVIMLIRAEVFLDAAIEIFNLSIALRMSQGRLRVLDIQDCEKFGRHFVDKFFASIRMDLRWWSKLIDPAIQDHLLHRGSFFVGDGHDHRYLGESIGCTEHVFVVA